MTSQLLTPLPASKSQCTTEELRQHALMAMARVTGPDVLFNTQTAL